MHKVLRLGADEWIAKVIPTSPSVRFARLIATVGGIGTIPAMPGTWASAAALPVAWMLHMAGGVPLLALATLLAWRRAGAPHGTYISIDREIFASR